MYVYIFAYSPLIQALYGLDYLKDSAKTFMKFIPPTHEKDGGATLILRQGFRLNTVKKYIAHVNRYILLITNGELQFEKIKQLSNLLEEGATVNILVILTPLKYALKLFQLTSAEELYKITFIEPNDKGVSLLHLLLLHGGEEMMPLF